MSSLKLSSKQLITGDRNVPAFAAATAFPRLFNQIYTAKDTEIPQKKIALFGNSFETSLREQFLNNNKKLL
jgi:hypothetical protein